MPSTATIYPPAINFDKDPMIFEMETSLKTGSPGSIEFTEDNLSGYLQVYATYDDENNATEHFIVELEPNYNTLNGKTAADLRNLMNFKMSPPADTSILASGKAAHALGRVSGRMKVVFGDQFGAPKLIEDPLTVGSWFKVVAGASKYWNGFSGKYSQNIIMLNSLVSFRRRATNNIIVKDIMAGQPEYVSFYCPAAAQTLTITANVLLDDGTLNSNVSLGTVSLPLGVSAVRCNLEQLGILTTYPTAVKYKLIFKSGATQIGSITYQIIRNEPENNIFVLMETGTGGVETVRVSGKNEYGQKVSYVEFERPIWLGSNFRDGLIDKTFTQGQAEIRCNSGYVQREYAEHLAQLAYGRVWLIDTVRKKFLAYNVTNTSIKESEDGSDLHNVEFTIEQAWKSFSSSSFNQ